MISSNLNSNLLRFHCVRPNLGTYFWVNRWDFERSFISFSVRTYIFLFIWLPNFYSVFFVVSTVSNLFKWLTQYSAALLLHQGLFSRSDLGEHKNMHTCVNNLTYLIHLRGHSITTYVIWKIHNGMAAPSKSAVWSIWLGRRLE